MLAVYSKSREIEKKAADHNHDEYIAIPKFDKLTTKNVAARLKQAILVTNTDFDDKLKSFNQKINSNKEKYLLFENKFKKLQTFDSSYFIGKSHFEEDGIQNYLVFQPMSRYFKRVSGAGNGNYILFFEI